MAEPQSPLRDPVSVSCAWCGFSDFGRYDRLEPVAVSHAIEALHEVRLYLGLHLVGSWGRDGKFESQKQEGVWRRSGGQRT